MASDHVTDVTDANFEAEVLQSDIPVLVDFWASWCRPCLAIAPLVEKLAEEHQGTLKVVKLDVQNNRNTAMKLKVTNIPTLLVFKGGAIVAKHVGAGGGLTGLQKLVSPHVA